MNTLTHEVNFNQTIVSVLAQICHLSNFIYGEVWHPVFDQKILHLSPHYYIHSSNFNLLTSIEQFWLCSQDFILSRGEGLPGRVWLSKQPEWILDVTTESEGYFLRNQIAKAFGIKTGFAVPVLADHQVLMVLAFFSLDIYPQNLELLEIVMNQTHKLALTQWDFRTSRLGFSLDS